MHARGDVQAEDRLAAPGSRARPARSSACAPPSSPSGGISSAGWKMNLTLPRSCRRASPASTSATPIRMAVWQSWPQACITPTSSPFQVVRTLEANGRSTCSTTGKASMSARSATTGPGRAPRRSPTTPVWATPVRTWSKPSRAQVRRDQARGAGLAVAELGVFVEVAAPGNDVGLRRRRPPHRCVRPGCWPPWATAGSAHSMSCCLRSRLQRRRYQHARDVLPVSAERLSDTGQAG